MATAAEVSMKVIRRYDGKGYVTLWNRNTYPTDFTAIQASDGTILICVRLRIRSTHSELYSVSFGTGVVTRLEGKTTEGLMLAADEGLYVIDFTIGPEKKELVLNSGHLTVRAARSLRRRSRAVFGFVNLDFVGNEATSGDEYYTLSRMRLRLPASEVFFEKLPGYEQLLETAKGRLGVQMTCTLVCPIARGQRLAEVQNVADDLSLLLSIARARFINYIYCDVLDTEGTLLMAEHWARITRSWPERSFPPIDYRHPSDTEHFIHSVLGNLPQLKREYQHTRADRVVWKIVHAALDAHTAGFYLTGALVAVCLLDFLRGDWARRHRRAELLREATLRRHRKRIENDFRAVLEREFPHLDEQKIDLMLRHVEGLRWWPTRASYRDFLASPRIRLNVPKQELNRFIGIRNSLVHRMEFPSDDSAENWRDYLGIMDLLNRVLLAVLDYQGFYLNCVELRRMRLQRLAQ